MYKVFFKRFIDILLAIIGMPLFFVVLMVTAPAIYIEDRGPVFYNAPRLGKNGKVFTMYKFRTMKVNAPDIRNTDGSTFNAEDDPRLTRTGKFLRKTSLDEAPQLINVLKGDMSVIGPRPDLPEFIDIYDTNEAGKLVVLPGITGYSQAYYRNTVPWKERVQHDLYYIDNMSFMLDIRVFFKTAISVINRRNINILQQ